MRVMVRKAKLADPRDVAWLLASYARQALARVEAAGELAALITVKQALQDALAMTFDEDKGEHFFRSTLVQTLFYGVFSAWVLWAERFPPQPADARFDLWNDTRSSTIPVIPELFHQLTEPGSLKVLGLEELLKWAVAALNRVDRPTFFATFDQGDAVQYFYEPFLKEFDPKLRKAMGVWYTPKEIVQYMVQRVDTVLKSELGVAAGLADERVVVLDPACGTGAFLVEILKFIRDQVEANEGPVAGGNAARTAILNRVYGFEILSAPFVVAHLQIGLLLSRWQATLNNDQRAQVYLTNALTDWIPGHVRSKPEYA